MAGHGEVSVRINADVSGFLAAMGTTRSATSRMHDRIQRAARAAQELELDLELTTAAVDALMRGLPPVVAQAGLEARFYVRGALAPAYADRDRADRYARLLARRNRGAAVAFMRGMSERAGVVATPAHTFRRWGDDGIAVVTR